MWIHGRYLTSSSRWQGLKGDLCHEMHFQRLHRENGQLVELDQVLQAFQKRWPNDSGKMMDWLIELFEMFVSELQTCNCQFILLEVLLLLLLMLMMMMMMMMMMMIFMCTVGAAVGFLSHHPYGGFNRCFVFTLKIGEESWRLLSFWLTCLKVPPRDSVLYLIWGTLSSLFCWEFENSDLIYRY